MKAIKYLLTLIVFFAVSCMPSFAIKIGLIENVPFSYVATSTEGYIIDTKTNKSIYRINPMKPYKFMAKNNFVVIESAGHEYNLGASKIQVRPTGKGFCSAKKRWYRGELIVMAFERIKTTHEIRMRLLNELNIKYQEYYLCPMGMDWMTGVYDNESGIFLTQIYKIPDGLSHAGDCYEYAVLLDDGRCFRVTANGDNKPFFKLPPKFTNLTDLILSATIAYGYNLEAYRFRLTLDQSEVNRITEEMNSRAKIL